MNILSHTIDYEHFPTSDLSVDTTDVQLAVVQFDNNQTLAVTCHFAEGSQALGCHAELSFSSDSQAVNISRVDRSLIICQEIMTRFPSHCYRSQLFVYDWEADGTVGTVPIPTEAIVSEDASNACGMLTPTSETITPTSGPVNPGVCLCIHEYVLMGVTFVITVCVCV